MYKAQLKRVRATRRALRAQQDQLHQLELDGIVGVTFHTLGQKMKVGISASASSSLVDVVREALRERLQELKKETERLRLDWREHDELRAHDLTFLSQAKRAQANGLAPVPYTLPV
jgi:hypothetical protein